MNKLVYLDYAAATPLDPKVFKAMEPYFADKFYNPSAIYLAARDVRQSLEQARAEVAGCLGSRPVEIIFTAGATEANNLAIQGVMRAFPGGEVLVSAIEHDSVLAPAVLYDGKLIPVDKNGLVAVAALEKLITDNTVLFSIGLLNNEIGTIQPLREFAVLRDKIVKDRLARGIDMPLYLHTDAAQAGNFLDLHVSRLGVDLISINGGKLYGPKQSGVLYIKAGTKLEPLIVGGGQERGMRSGTENVAASIGFATALKLAQVSKDASAKRITELRDLFVAELSSKVPGAILNKSSKSWAPHILSVSFPGQDNERLMMELDEAGIICAVGSACSASSEKPSHVLSAIGLDDKLARSTLRFSLGRHTTRSDIEKTIAALSRLISG